MIGLLQRVTTASVIVAQQTIVHIDIPGKSFCAQKLLPGMDY